MLKNLKKCIQIFNNYDKIKQKKGSVKMLIELEDNLQLLNQLHQKLKEIGESL